MQECGKIPVGWLLPQYPEGPVFVRVVGYRFVRGSVHPAFDPSLASSLSEINYLKYLLTWKITLRIRLDKISLSFSL